MKNLLPCSEFKLLRSAAKFSGSNCVTLISCCLILASQDIRQMPLKAKAVVSPPIRYPKQPLSNDELLYIVLNDRERFGVLEFILTSCYMLFRVTTRQKESLSLLCCTSEVELCLVTLELYWFCSPKRL